MGKNIAMSPETWGRGNVTLFMRFMPMKHAPLVRLNGGQKQPGIDRQRQHVALRFTPEEKVLLEPHTPSFYLHIFENDKNNT